MAVLRKDNIDDSCICVLSSYSSHAGDRLFLSLFGGVGWPSSLPCPPSPTVHPVRSATAQESPVGPRSHRGLADALPSPPCALSCSLCYAVWSNSMALSEAALGKLEARCL